MTKRDFFILAIKLYGLNVLVNTFFSGIPTEFIRLSNSRDSEALLWITLVLVVFGCLFWFLIFNADAVVRFLKLDKGFEEDRIELGNLNASSILKLGVFIIGGLVLMDSIPRLVSQLYWAFRGEINGFEFNDKDKFGLLVNVVNVLLGYLLMTSYELVARKFSAKNADEKNN